MIINLNNKNALVCGSTQGIGLSIAELFAKNGANVTLFARDEEKLKSVLNGLANNGSQNHSYIVADFDNLDLIKTQIDAQTKNGKKYHILVNNTGGPKGGEITKAELSEFEVAFKRHVLVNQTLTQALLEGMKAENYGRIINIISTSVKVPINNLGVSNTIRAAVANWAKTTANEVGKYGITVNNVLPGFTATGRLEDIVNNRSKASGKTPEEIEAEIKKDIPAGRFASPEEVANAVLFLASPEAGYINGINLPVDGGRLGCL